jgi:hypothetical protein
MSNAALLNMDDPWWPFNHAMAHREWLGVMAPLTRFSLVPYFIEPMIASVEAAGPWALRHQQAHNDAMASLPSSFGATTVGLFIGGNLIDTNLGDQGQQKWLEFQNEQEHYVANTAITPPNTYPFW